MHVKVHGKRIGGPLRATEELANEDLAEARRGRTRVMTGCWGKRPTEGARRRRSHFKFYRFLRFQKAEQHNFRVLCLPFRVL